MNYRSFSDLSRILREAQAKIPTDIDLVVGIPRSGMLVANLIALNSNVNACDIDSFIANRSLSHGQTRKIRNSNLKYPHDAQHVLVVDDSIDTGASLDNARASIARSQVKQKTTFAACFATDAAKSKVDLFFEILPKPRIFEWNLMHRSFLAECCLDIDGVLCMDPTAAQNDDGTEYLRFLKTALPLALPTYPIAHLVTSRLEKYRAQTEAWLEKFGITYKALHMLDLPDAATRRKLRCHAAFKAEIYAKLHETKLFIESDPAQAQEIVRLTGKHVLCYSTQQFLKPAMSYAHLRHTSGHIIHKISAKLYGKFRIS